MNPAIHDAASLCEVLAIPFSSEQLAAIMAPLEPGVVLAGAGSGKTTVMAARVVWLVGTGRVRPDQVLGLTFTRKAAAELGHRITVALGESGLAGLSADAAFPEVLTYDSFASRLVTDHGLRLGVDPGATMIADATRYRLAARVVQRRERPLPLLSRVGPDEIADKVLHLDQELRAHLVEPDAVREFTREFLVALDQAPTYRGKPYAAIRDAGAVAGERLELLDLVEAYRRLKAELGVVEFADQMAVAADLVARVPGVARVVRAQYPVVLLDEYQDTSSAQATLLTGLFSAGHGRGHAVTAVGDPRQAIYGWRGAAASNILTFPEAFPRADGSPARSFPLSTNRRSGQEVLDLANRVASTLTTSSTLSGAGGQAGESATSLVAPPEAAPAQVVAATFATFDEEVAWLADQVVDEHREGLAEKWSDIAVLLRRNSEIAPVVTALGARDVPVELVGLGGLLDLPGIRDVVDTLTLLADVRANPSVVRLLSGPRWRIGPRDLALLGARAARVARPADSPATADPDSAVAEVLREADPGELTCLLDAVDDPGDIPLSPRARARIGVFSRELQALRAHASESPLELTHRVVRTIGLDIEARARPGGAGWTLADQVDTLLEAVADYSDVDGDDSLAGMLAWFEAERHFGDGLDQSFPGTADAVRVMTTHRAKGLEWDIVHLPALVQGVFPTDRSDADWIRTSRALPAPLRGDADSIPQAQDCTRAAFDEYHKALKEETGLAEDRLAYVAVTRARRRLVATGHTWRAGHTRPRQWSRYLRLALQEAERHATLGPVSPEVSADSGEQNPLDAESGAQAWPVVDVDEQERLAGLAREVSALAAQGTGSGAVDAADTALPPELRDVVAQWDRDADALLADALAHRAGVVEVELPGSLSASALMGALRDPDRFARARLRPMPRPVSGGARRGSLFHEWVQRHYEVEPTLLDADDWAGPGLTDDEREEATGSAGAPEDLGTLLDTFRRSPWFDRVPVAVEQPFVLRLGGVSVRGRIDAVFAGEHPGSWLVVDWKTSETPADPVQLSLYRLAWARLRGVDPSSVDALFWHVRRGVAQVPDRLLDEEQLTAWLADPEAG